MHYAVNDAQGNEIVGWSSARLAREVLRQAVVERMPDPPRPSRFPWRRRAQEQAALLMDVGSAVEAALLELAEEVRTATTNL